MTPLKLNEYALVTSLTISQWSARKLDKNLSNEVDQRHTVKGAGNFNKKLILPERLKGIRSAADNLRSFYLKNTLPWNDDGGRLLPTVHYLDFIAGMGSLRSQFEHQVVQFITNWDEILLEERIRLNGLFNEREYPDKNKLAQKFACTLSYLPAPDPQIMGTNLDEATRQQLQREAEQTVQQRIQAATDDMWKRVREQLVYMKERFANPDAKLYQSSLHDSLRELIGLLPKLNLTGDPKIEAICDDMESLLDIPVTDIRKDADVRKDQAHHVDTLLRSYAEFF